jgi:leucyl-tRNA synthetase
MDYNFKEIEKKWQQYWEKHQTFKTDIYDFSKPKYYALDMFPYPSGVGLHAGHPEGYTATDIVSRMKRMQGFNVLHPMGFDSFGLPAEQYAIKTGNHPGIFTKENIKTFETQLKSLGFSFDWNREISTSDPSFYKWTQWIFIQLYNKGLAKLVDMPVNWCEELGTVLSNDEIIDGKSERGGYPVVRKNMKQWVIEIPKYADKLLNGLNEIDWPESTKEMQRNWIGKSTGVEVDFKIVGGGKFSIYTTCIETIYGITFMVLAPENKLVDELKSRITNWSEVEKYCSDVAKMSDIDRTELNKGKNGIELKGIKAIHPLTNKEIPVFLGDFVLASYGTGAVMAVPTHDARDYAFAKKYHIPMITVITGGSPDAAYEKQDYLINPNAKLINSEEFNGLSIKEAKIAITKKLINEGNGREQVNYRIRNWIFARQRYWGEPIPIVHYEDGTMEPLDLKDLPLVLPELQDYSPSKTGASPLDKANDWVNINYHGKKAMRETSTMPGAAGSSWYFLRYIDPQNDQALADKKLIDHWMPVDLYVGGPEHAVGHLLYSRMWNQFLYDEGYTSVKEPFKKLVHQGMILGSNGIKMGKRYPEYSVNPTDIVNKYGADTLRLYEMFMGPLGADKPWSNEGVIGSHRFLERVWRLYQGENKITKEDNPHLIKVYNETIKKITDDYETLNFNTAISQLMIFINAVYKENNYPQYMAEDFLKLLNPICPFITEELWQLLGHNDTISYEKWPKYDDSKLTQDTKEIGVQVNGKLRATIVVNTDDDEDTLKEKALKEPNVIKNIEGKEIIKVIAIKGRIVNIVVK